VAKKVVGFIKLQVPAGKANPSPPIGPALGQHGVNPGQFITQFNARTAALKGKVVLLNFWATWCPPCKLEIPWFIELKKKYSGQGLEILGVSIDDHAPELKAFAAQYKMNYPVLVGLDHDALLEAFDAVESVPVTWFIRKDGIVQGRNIGINTREFFENQIKALF